MLKSFGVAEAPILRKGIQEVVTRRRNTDRRSPIAEWLTSSPSIGPKKPPAVATARLADQQTKYHAALDAGQALERSIVIAVDGVRGRVSVLEKRWVQVIIFTAVLVAAWLLPARIAHAAW